MHLDFHGELNMGDNDTDNEIILDYDIMMKSTECSNVTWLQESSLLET